MRRAFLTVLVEALLAAGVAAQDKPLAFVNAHLIPIAGPEVDKGVLIVQGGKIVAVGPEGTAIPEGAERIDLAGKVVLPGLVDTHSHIGGAAGGDQSAPLQPECRVLDALDVHDAGLQKAQAGGITTVNVMSGSGHLLSGQTVYLKLRDGRTIDDLLIRLPDGTAAGGVKMANGTNSMRGAPFPGTRAKSAALARQLLVKAQEHRDKLRKAAEGKGEPPPRELGLEALVEVLDGKRVVHHHTHRHDDILTVLRLAQEFQLRVVLHHVSDGWKVADKIAAAKVPCSVIVIDSPGGKIEAMDLVLGTGAALEKAGALVAFHTDDGITDSRLFLRSAALAVRAGMTRDGALRALTIAGAQMLDLQARVGSLEAGKDADLVVLSGDPFSVYTRVEQTWVEGVKVFDLANARDRLWAEGGYGASRPQAWHLCCCGGDDDAEAR